MTLLNLPTLSKVLISESTFTYGCFGSYPTCPYDSSGSSRRPCRAKTRETISSLVSARNTHEGSGEPTISVRHPKFGLNPRILKNFENLSHELHTVFAIPHDFGLWYDPWNKSIVSKGQIWTAVLCRGHARLDKQGGLAVPTAPLRQTSPCGSRNLQSRWPA